MSKQDTHFFNVFSMVIGILVGIAVLLFVFSKIVGSSTQVEHLKSDALQVAAVEERIKPFARVAVAGQDNSALAIEQPATAAAPAPAVATAGALSDGPSVYQAACVACHGLGIAGAPKMGDAAAWAPRIAQGNAILYQHAIQGYQGKAGVMPPKGGRMDISDELVRKAVDYMVSQSQ